LPDDIYVGQMAGISKGSRQVRALWYSCVLVLRAEILSRMNHRWQMLGLIGAIVTFTSAQSGSIAAG
jgi:hypothetical protein